MVPLAQDGPAAFRDRYERLSQYRAEGPNAIWQADHPLLAILVLDANGAAVRPWLTLIREDDARAVAGYPIFLGHRPRGTPRWPYARRCGVSRMPRGPSAGCLMCAMSILAVMAPARLASRSRQPSMANWSLRRSDGRRAAGRVRGSWGPGLRHGSPRFRGISATGNPRHLHDAHGRSSIPPLGTMSWAPRTIAPIVPAAWHHSRRGVAQGGCRGCRRVWRP